MPDIDISKAMLFLVFVLPGIVSAKFYQLKCPAHTVTAKEILLEILSFSAVNALLTLPFIEILNIKSTLALWAFALITCFLSPLLWPILLIKLLAIFEKKHWILIQARTAWDDFFYRTKSGCWLIVHLKNGEVLGGKFCKKSYAGAFPNNGHIFLEELWEINDKLEFVKMLPGKQGVILRPDDYNYIRVFNPDFGV